MDQVMKTKVLEVLPCQMVAVALELPKSRKPELRLAAIVGEGKARQIVLFPQNLERTLDARIPSVGLTRAILAKVDGDSEESKSDEPEDADVQL